MLSVLTVIMFAGRFMYATPFTMDGRAHGELVDQYKRKTILTTSHAFPYVKTRLAVIDRQQVCIYNIATKVAAMKLKIIATMSATRLVT